ncbi:MAG: ABC transporter ATP-binding protein [Intrasporangium sp.]|uniref:ABC transporter ATP-binding protein n=1 Tax=Intrasporangium sp. TaxID=1925024 RepID=UPI002647EA2B|nr:ABC transporter ATP-binding protein [Intrasporangium sp.]MDN5794879.1 ABC transporter ATP-binding protein [Intrasporangium sp.]
MTVVTSSRPEGVTMKEPALVVEGLNVGTGSTRLVKNISFTIRAGERVGLIGESGSGKSLTVTSIMGLLGEGLTATGSIRMAGVPHDLVDATQKQFAALRGRQVAMVFQEPMTALNPTMRVLDQVAEGMLAHGTAPGKRQAREAALDLLRKVQLPDPERAAKAYPHQMSGGQRQRVVLAIALANDPMLLLCDEPTTALDVTVQAQMLQLILSGVRERGSALLFITHDLAVVATICERLLVMYGGRIVEAGPVQRVLSAPQHPYTRGLLEASELDASDENGRLPTMSDHVRAQSVYTQDPEWIGDPEDGYAKVILGGAA